MNILNFTSEFHRLRGKFQINDGYKKNGRYFVFRSHAMRKYAGSNILEYTDLGFLKTEFIMGHKRQGHDRGYYKKHAGELWKAYITGLSKLSINWDEMDLATAEDHRTLKQRLAAQNEIILTLERNRMQNETLIQQISDNYAYKIELLEVKMMKFLAQAKDHGLNDFKELPDEKDMVKTKEMLKNKYPEDYDILNKEKKELKKL